MEIKNIREPNNEEQESIIPKIILFGASTAIVTLVVYLLNFNFELNESMYLTDKILSTKTAAQHDFLIKIFELIYHRDYMENHLEGISISALISAVFNSCIALGFKIQGKLMR